MRNYAAKGIAVTLMVVVLVTAASGFGAFVFHVEQDGPSTVITGSGTLNVAGLSAGRSGPDSAEVSPYVGLLSVGLDTSATAYSTISGPASLGPGENNLLPTINSGDHVGVAFGTALVVPYGYVSGSLLSDTDTYFEETLAQLGLTQGQYVYTWGSGPTADSLTINIGTPVPEPASVAALALPATLALLRRRQRRNLI